MYYGLAKSKGGNLTQEIKGLASVRKDCLRIVQSLVNNVCDHMCSYSTSLALAGVQSLVADSDPKALIGMATIDKCSIEKRRGGMSYLVFQNDKGNTKWLRTDQKENYTDLISREWVRSSMRLALNPILEACGMLSVEIMCKNSLMSDYDLEVV